MDEQLILEWNGIVTPEDETFICGDVAFHPSHKAAAILNRLNGTKILIEGNHDRKALKDPNFRKCFESVHKYYDTTINGTKVIMFHYPILEWDQMHRGSVHFFGHVHGGESGLEKYRARDAGYDATGRIVTLIDDLIADALKGEIRGHH